MSDELLKVEVKYYPYTEPQLWIGDAATFTHDQCKMNLLWLVHPDVDAAQIANGDIHQANY